MSVLIGADPEMFVFNPTDGAFVSAHGMIPGTKYEPYEVEHGAVQVDGLAAEFNIKPAANLGEFLTNLTSVRKQLEEMIHESNPDFQLVATPTAKFHPQYFADLPLESKILGCDPDFNAWTGEMQQPNEGDIERPIRAAGGHIHIGWTKDADPESAEMMNDSMIITKQLDCSLYLLSFLWDSDKVRRKMYGAVGSFRAKPYGCEYRTLSNAWLRDDNIASYVYVVVRRAVQLADEGTRLFDDEFLVALVHNKKYSKKDAIDVMHYLSSTYGFPVMPENMLKG